MKKVRRVLMLLLALMPILASVRLARELPVDTAPYIAAKYAGWSGVLRAWIHTGWEPGGGSFIPWLNESAQRFERAHEGVYLEFEEMPEDALVRFREGGLRPLDLLLFPPGLFSAPDGFADLNAPARYVAAADCGAIDGKVQALPVAMGGYIRVVNPALGEGDDVCAPRITDGRYTHYSAALIALADDSVPAPANDDTGDIDLGLPAAAVERADALKRFINGETRSLVVTQRELAQLEEISAAGHGPAWELRAAGECAFCDQLLLCAAVCGDDKQAGARLNCARAFIDFLLTDECQARLGAIGALPVTGVAAGGSSALRELGASLGARTLLAPAAFAPFRQSDIADLAARLQAGEIEATAAVQRLRALLTADG